jgi:hypothetical protein
MLVVSGISPQLSHGVNKLLLSMLVVSGITPQLNHGVNKLLLSMLVVSGISPPVKSWCEQATFWRDDHDTCFVPQEFVTWNYTPFFLLSVYIIILNMKFFIISSPFPLYNCLV